MEAEKMKNSEIISHYNFLFGLQEKEEEYKEEERKQLEDTIAEHIDRQVAVIIKENDTNRPFEDSHVDLEQVIHMDITYEDE